MRNLALAATAGLLAACAAAAPPPPVIGAESGFVCRNFDSSAFAGREATSALGSELLRASGARRVRWVPPGVKVTMEYRIDRLTVHLDERNRVVRANCG